MKSPAHATQHECGWRSTLPRASTFPLVFAFCLAGPSHIDSSAKQIAPGETPARVQAVLNQYCTSCHSQQLRTAGRRVEGEAAMLEAVALASKPGVDINVINTDGRTALDAARAQIRERGLVSRRSRRQIWKRRVA